MKKRMSLRIRLTLITSVLLMTLCIAFTVFGFFNVLTNVVESLETVYAQQDMASGSVVDNFAPLDKEAHILLTLNSTYVQYSLGFMLICIVSGTAIILNSS